MDIITTCIAGWRRGNPNEVSRHILNHTSSFSKLTHLIARDDDVEGVGPSGFTFTGDRSPVYYAVTIEVQNIPKAMTDAFYKAADSLEFLVTDKDEDNDDIVLSIISLLENVMKIKVTFTKYKSSEKSFDEVEEKSHSIRACPMLLADLIRSLKF